jgi:hypothetical protein
MSDSSPSEDSPVGSQHTGRDYSEVPNGSGNDPSALVRCTSRQAGIVIRAMVEHIGPAGDTELTVNVKWPAGAFGTPQFAQASSNDRPGTKTQVPPNGPAAHSWEPGTLYGESDPAPAQEMRVEADSAGQTVRPAPVTVQPAKSESKESNSR